ncbi:MAG TPA: sigma-70 family RNA polymerase sigma factor [Verrucomicrobiales bacterium]|nr:sigma-70 family RNA polymerase sigma factor [Verrucomicrobiae bacterium]MCP5552282.1 sigma-70 family RNA polymerase sigma factor [Akkermansiaceae bacterium]HRX54497.1 sigma-70 family RNA polymerase sigma factor [Verrucomicrobiales bacterium]
MSLPREDTPEMKATFARTRLSLIERLANWEDQRTWDEFYQTYWRLIFSVSLKSGLSSEEAMDVVQETVLAIAKQWKDGQRYDPAKGSFKTWLMNITRWRIADQYRRQARNPAKPAARRELEEPRDTATMDRIADDGPNVLERLWDAEWASNLATVALDRVKAKVSPQQYQIFDAYVVKGWEPGRVRRELGVSMAQVYLAKHRVGSLVRREVEALQKNWA